MATHSFSFPTTTPSLPPALQLSLWPSCWRGETRRNFPDRDQLFLPPPLLPAHVCCGVRRRANLREGGRRRRRRKQKRARRLLELNNSWLTELSWPWTPTLQHTSSVGLFKTWRGSVRTEGRSWDGLRHTGIAQHLLLPPSSEGLFCFGVTRRHRHSSHACLVLKWFGFLAGFVHIPVRADLAPRENRSNLHFIVKGQNKQFFCVLVIIATENTWREDSRGYYWCCW